MTEQRLAEILRGEMVQRTTSPKHADAIMQSSDWHVIRSFVRRESKTPKLRRSTPSQIACMVADADTGDAFILRVCGDVPYHLQKGNSNA